MLKGFSKSHEDKCKMSLLFPQLTEQLNNTRTLRNRLRTIFINDIHVLFLTNKECL